MRDPITGAEIIVKDADPKGESFAFFFLFFAYLLTIRIDFDSKQPATRGTNVLYHAFPPPQPVSLETALGKLKLIQYGIAGSVFFIWLTVSFGSGLVAFVYRSTLCSVTAFILMTALSLVERSLEKDVEKVRQDMGRQRGEAFSPPVPESVEWLNGLIKLVWGLVDPYAHLYKTDQKKKRC